MSAAQFVVGERVRVRGASPVARAGMGDAVGTIQLVYRSVDDLYEVRFAEYAASKLMRARDLEHADQERRS